MLLSKTILLSIKIEIRAVRTLFSFFVQHVTAHTACVTEPANAYATAANYVNIQKQREIKDEILKGLDVCQLTWPRFGQSEHTSLTSPAPIYVVASMDSSIQPPPPTGLCVCIV